MAKPRAEPSPCSCPEVITYPLQAFQILITNRILRDIVMHLVSCVGKVCIYHSGFTNSELQVFGILQSWVGESDTSPRPPLVLVQGQQAQIAGLAIPGQVTLPSTWRQNLASPYILEVHLGRVNFKNKIVFPFFPPQTCKDGCIHE